MANVAELAEQATFRLTRRGEIEGTAKVLGQSVPVKADIEDLLSGKMASDVLVRQTPGKLAIEVDRTVHVPLLGDQHVKVFDRTLDEPPAAGKLEQLGFALQRAQVSLAPRQISAKASLLVDGKPLAVDARIAHRRLAPGQLELAIDQATLSGADGKPVDAAWLTRGLAWLGQRLGLLPDGITVEGTSAVKVDFGQLLKE